MISFPPINNTTPIWTGHGFQIGDQIVPVLSYGGEQSGWNDDLTLLHEDTAGSNHFIDLASRSHAINEMRQAINLADQPVIMDIGCSSGFMLLEYRKKLPGAIVLGADAIRQSLDRLAHDMPDIPLLHFDLSQCPLPNSSLDGVSLLNVLEHIQDDRTALKHVYRILKPGGIAVIEVPSGPGLFDSYDRTLMHYRRYLLRGLVEMARNIGFKVTNRSHLGFFIYPGFWMVKKKNRLLDALNSTHSDYEKENNDVAVSSKEIHATGSNILLKWLIKKELQLGEKISYPYGIRCQVTLKK
jgi:SAM-dependent methyltransferase